MKYKGKRKISLEEANERLHKKAPSFDFVEYEAISKPAVVQCRYCGEKVEFQTASGAIASMGDNGNKYSDCFRCNSRLEVVNMKDDLERCITVGDILYVCSKYNVGYSTKLDTFSELKYEKSKRFVKSFIRKFKEAVIVVTVKTISLDIDREIDYDIEIKVDFEIFSYLKDNWILPPEDLFENNEDE